jgi:hypothetical protein
MVNFDEATHTYTVDGQIYPSVTQILVAEGFIDPTWFTEWSRQRGKLAHLCTHLDDTGELDESTVDPALAPYLEAYRRFKRESGFIVSGSEVQMAHAGYRFAGTLDKVGTFKDATCAIIDLETGGHQITKAIQTAAYEILKGSRYNRFALQLKDDGLYKLHPFVDRQDKSVFLSALSLYYWKLNNLKRRAA